jgi:protein-S-isoprenylcysteine O-methyltransferase Ste14
LVDYLRVRRDTLPNLAMCAGAFIAPLLPVASRLEHPAPWLAAATMFATLVTQPAVDRDEMMDRDATDARSALVIFVAVLGADLTAVVEYGYAPWAFGTTVWFVIGMLLAGTGLALRVWSIRTLGAWFSSTVRVREGQQVITSGPYRLIRHPSYTGALLVALGVTTMLGGPIGVALVVAVVIPAYIYRIRVEEAALSRELGTAYDAYAKRTHRLVPWLA